MKKKKIVLTVASLLGIFLIGCTILAFFVYDHNLIRVSTFYYRTDIDGNLWTKADYLPLDSITYNDRGELVVYRLQKRKGWFSEEYYVEDIPLDYYYNDNKEMVYRKDGFVRVITFSLEEGDQLVKKPELGLQNGVTVKWESGERGEYDAAVWD